MTGEPAAAYEDASSSAPRAAQLALPRAALEAEVPILGVGLGARLLAVVGGGTARPGEAPRIGWGEVRTAPGAPDDPLRRTARASARTGTTTGWIHPPARPCSPRATATPPRRSGSEPIAWGLHFHLLTAVP
ncbi:gamma-glutamyl-gamma-aminobutyrate hydrolase family protein [Streptomyces sp. NBC_01696]|uniref:gamma-glutamyl-gamma-aminobutyrate hydrolase family protein n=1 Tax=Streptomyces sp. NBC_01696 TaxID=2975913 RepID=UPI002E37E262|nr:gamma-glutamyl-gamma-aminobutyrate hydrolase family protein [Streptomyces sp. NBC_01696]